MEMGEMGVKNNNNNNNNNSRVGVGVVCRPHTTEQATTATTTQSTDFVLQWGNRKRLRCMKIQVKNESTSGDRTRRVRIDRSVFLRSNNNNRDSRSNFRRHFSSPPPPPLIPIPHRISASSRNCEGDMKRQSNGVVVTSCSAEEKAQDNKRNNINGNGNGNGGSASSETALDSKKGGGSSSGSDPIAVWLPKFVISLTNKEKEEDFMAIKGSKLPQRPKKRAKFIQRTLNFVSPGSLLCDLTLERYEVREKKISKKRPRGLKAMGNLESDSE